MDIIDTLKFQSFSIQLKDIIEEQTKEGILYITDAMVLSSEFESFISFYREHVEPGKYFNVVLNNKGFYGRFGQLYYSEGETCYDIRLVFVESKNDINQDDKSLVETVVARDAEYFNLINLVSKQEVIINRLKAVLESKGILTPSELEEVFTVQEDRISDVKFEMATKVKDLNNFLKEQKDTMSDIRNDLI